jgi:very-short-patch-repair endonuclease
VREFPEREPNHEGQTSYSETTCAPTASRQTNAEQALWALFVTGSFVVLSLRRQHPIGPFVADFCCPQRKLVVELDGGQHAEEIAADQKRSRFLEEHDYRVLRLWNHDVLKDTVAVQRSEYVLMKTFTLRPEPVLSDVEGRLGGEIPSLSSPQSIGRG